MGRNAILRSLLASTLVFVARPALAWGSLLLIEPPPASGTLAIGPSVWTLPKYPGARGTTATVLPGVDGYAASGLFASTDTGLGWNLSRRADLQYGARLWPQLGRSQADTPPGLSRIGTRLQLEAFANYAPLPALLLQAGVLRGAGRHHDGTQVEIGATSGLPLGQDLLAIGLATTFANRAYRQGYLGVSAAESAASGVPAWSIGSGWHDVSLTFSAEHRLTEAWRVSGQWVTARLLGTARGSPLTASARQSAATLTLWRQL